MRKTHADYTYVRVVVLEPQWHMPRRVASEAISAVRTPYTNAEKPALCSPRPRRRLTDNPIPADARRRKPRPAEGKGWETL